MASNSHERGQSVVSRLLRVLEAFSPERPDLTIAEIGQRTGIPQSTLYRLLAEPVGHGALERSADGRYSVGLRLWEIGKLAPRPTRLADVAGPYLHDLFQVAHADVRLAVLAGGEALYVETICGHRPVERTGRTGTRVPLTSTSIGQVLLAHAPSEVLEQVLADEARPTTDVPAVPHQRLRAVLADIRRSGIAVSRAGGAPLAVAAPVFGSPTGVAALGLTASEQAEPRLIIPMVCTTAQRVSRELLGSVAANGIDAGCTVAAAPFAPPPWGRANCP